MDDSTMAEVLRLRVQGYSWATIAHSLNARQIPTPSGTGDWWASSVRRATEPTAAQTWAAYMRAYRGR